MRKIYGEYPITAEELIRYLNSLLEEETRRMESMIARRSLRVYDFLILGGAD